jgi:hypothetical protein
LLESFTEEKQSCTRFTEEITSSSAAPLPVSPSEKNTQKQIVEYPEDKHRFTTYPDHFLSLITTIRQKKNKAWDSYLCLAKNAPDRGESDFLICWGKGKGKRGRETGRV